MDATRRFPRIKKLLLVTYIASQDGKQTTPVSIGRILDLNQVGFGLEVFAPIEIDSEMIMEIDFNGELIDTTGKIVHCRGLEDGKWVIGISFLKPDQRFSMDDH